MQRRHDLSGKTIVSTNVIPPFRFIVICVNTDVSAGRREGGGGVAACTVVNKKKKVGTDPIHGSFYSRNKSPAERMTYRAPIVAWNLLHFLLHLPSPSVSFPAPPLLRPGGQNMGQDFNLPICKIKTTFNDPRTDPDIYTYTHTHIYIYNGTDLSIHGRCCSLQIRKCFMRVIIAPISPVSNLLPLPFCPK